MQQKYFERLETRRMFAVTAYEYGWVLVVEGDAARNWISVESSGGLVRVMDYTAGASIEVGHFDALSFDEIEIYGNNGNDMLLVANNVMHDVYIHGGNGADYLRGGGGEADLWGASPNGPDDNSADTLVSGMGDTYLWGQGGNDQLFTDNYNVSGNDFMFGGDGNDTFTIRGHDSNASAVGEAGNDTFIAHQNSTQHVEFEGGAGTDTVEYSAWTAAIYATPNGLNDSGLKSGARNQLIETDVEIVDGTNFNDHFSGTNGGNAFLGNGGNDLMFGYGGNDSLLGGDGNDTVYAGGGNDYLFGGDGDDYLAGDQDNDVAFGGNGLDSIHGGDGNDQLYGEGNSDYLYGEAGNDKHVGGTGADYIDAHDGVFGNDLVYGNNEGGSGGLPGEQDVAWIDRWYQNGIWLQDLTIGVESVV